MKTELHLHTNRYSACSRNSPTELMTRLIETGYGAVYITEHDSVWDDYELDELRGRFPRIRIFPGMEITLDMQHLLVLGTNDPDYLKMKDTGAILARAKTKGHLTILAHPYRWDGGAAMLDEGLLPDAIEYRTFNQDGPNSERAMARAKELSLPLVNAGDTHALDALDRFWIETDRPIENPRDIRQIILNGEYAMKTKSSR